MNTFWFTFKVWQTSVILPPLLYAFFGIVINCSIEFFPLRFLALVIFGTIFSFPSFLLFWFATHFIMHTALTSAHQKLLLSATGVLLTVLPYILLCSFFPRDKTLIWFIIPYAGVIVASAYYYKNDLNINNNHLAQ